MLAPRVPRLRPYQLAIVSAVLDSVRDKRGLTLCVEISRQGGKNETQLRLEAALLYGYSQRGGTIIKTAPTLEPQLRTSYQRLADYLDADNLPYRAAWPQLHVGRATIDMRSAEPTANVRGATASLLLEADEAQDIDPDIFDRRFRPMAATTNATTVLWGTAWSDDSLLQRTINTNAKLEEADGIRRNFLYDWRHVAQYVDAYDRFVTAERIRLGPDNPIFKTEYELIPVAGAGRLLTPAQIDALYGDHPRTRAPVIADTYVAGLDIGGEDTGSARPNDETVLTIARLAPPNAAQRAAGIKPAQIVDHVAWRGARHAEIIPELARVLLARRIQRVHVDATGVGEATAALLAASVRGRCTVAALKFTQPAKSALGFQLITAINTGALTLYAADGSPEHAAITYQASRARMEPLPSRQIRWYVPERDGNDDYLTSAALVVAAANAHEDRRAVGRRNE